MKKWVSVMLAGMLLLAVLPMGTLTVEAEDENRGFEKYTYKVYGEEVAILNVDNDISGEIVIPSSIEGYPVTGISEGAFHGCDQIVTLKIPASVEVIEESAFEGCNSLTEFTVGFTSKTYVAWNGVLYNKDRTTLVCYPANKADATFAVPDGVKSIDISAFTFAANLESVTIADGVERIGKKAFYGCSGLKRIKFGVGLTKIGDEAFSGCKALGAVRIPNSVTSLGRAAFSECETLSEVTVGSGLTSIGGTLFLNCTALKAVAIPDNVTSLGSSAFSGCSGLETITIPRTVKAIGAYTFYRCTNLKTVCYTGSQADQEGMLIGAKNEPLGAAQWQYHAASVIPPAADTPVGPQPDTYIDWRWALIAGLAVLLTAVLVVVVVSLVKGIKARK